jgi:hypothetical protein
MSAERDQPVRSGMHLPGLPASPHQSSRDREEQSGKTGLPPCLFYDSVTQFFCLLRKRPNRARDGSCAGCAGT